jgi:predicted nucleic acid-binding protein
VKRIIISPTEKEGVYEVTKNPILIYFDTSAIIDIFREYHNNGKNIAEEIGDRIGNRRFRILLSVVNFLELIGTKGDISLNFSESYLNAIKNIKIISANQPTVITNQEVLRFIEYRKVGIMIFDSDHAAAKNMQKAVEERKQGETTWLSEQRKWWDEREERDKVLDLEADLMELSGAKSSPSEIDKLRDHIINCPIDEIRNRKLKLTRAKQIYQGRKQIPSERTEIYGYAANRITVNVNLKYGREKVWMLMSNRDFIFPGEPNFRRDYINDLARGTELTFKTVKTQMPGLYWQAKITYFNQYNGNQRSGGKQGDRNHAVYLPYSNYFATCDRIMADAIQTEHRLVFKRGNIHLFKIK